MFSWTKESNPQGSLTLRPVYARGMEMLDICYSSQLIFDHFLLKLKNMLLHPSIYWEPTIWRAPFVVCEIPQIHKKKNKNKNPLLMWFTSPQRKRNNPHGKARSNCCGESEVGCGRSGLRGMCGHNSDRSGQGDCLETLIPVEKI